MRRADKDGEEIGVSAADPLNLISIVLPGPRLSALSSENLRLRDGIPLAPHEPTASSASPVASRVSI